MRIRIIGLLILVVIGFTVNECSSADRNNEGEITKSGDVDAFDIQTGDCFNDLPLEDLSTVTSVEAVPCNEAHHWQAFYSGTLTNFSFVEESVRQATSLECNQAMDSLFNDMSAIKFDAFKNAELAYIYPTSESWSTRSDRVLDCLIGSDEDSYFTSVLD